MKRVTIQALQQFSAYVDGRTVDLLPGRTCEMPEDQARDFARAGLASIVVDNAAPTITATIPLSRVEHREPARREEMERDGVAAIIVNYNMPERADALAQYIKDHCQGVEVILVDNGSDQITAAQNTSLLLGQNVQTTAGWLMGLHYADALARKRGKGWFAYWFLITSAELIGGDPLAPMVELLKNDNNAVGVHPAVEADVIAWKHLLTRGGSKPRRVWMIDNIASLYRAEWFDSIGRFDPALKFAWGIDLETGYQARQQGRSLWVHEGSRVRKVTDIGYTLNRMGMSAQDRRVQAEANMEKVLASRYGAGWRDMMWNAHRDFAENEMISVIIPTYNRPDLLPRALESLKSQTYQNFEAIVVNDGGMDVADIVDRYPFARYIAHDQNKGLPAARNTAIRASQGGYIAYLDDDDWYYANHLETLVRGIRGHRAAYTNAHAVDREYGSEKERYVFGNDYSPDFILRQNVFPCNTVLHERALFDEAGPFDETLPNSEDWDMWIRISLITPWHHIPIATCAVDRTRPTMSSDRPAMMAVFDKIRSRYAGGKRQSPTAIDWETWRRPHPIGISGCVRVRNDAEFLRPAVISHLPYCDEIVLAVQPSEDGTESIAEQLAREYPKVRVVKYPLIPIYINDPAWETTPEDDPKSFVYVSNWALSQCRYSWIMKFEADVIALSSLGQVVTRIQASPHERRYYGRVVLNVAGPEYKLINATVPCNGGWDEGIMPNSPEYKFVKAGKYEAIHYAIGPHECVGWSGLHLKHAKKRYWGKINEVFVPFDRANVALAMEKWLASHTWPGTDNPRGEDCLFEDGWRAYCPPWGTDEK